MQTGKTTYIIIFGFNEISWMAGKAAKGVESFDTTTNMKLLEKKARRSNGTGPTKHTFRDEKKSNTVVVKKLHD
jgi:hypothetical protein